MKIMLGYHIKSISLSAGLILLNKVKYFLIKDNKDRKILEVAIYYNLTIF